MEVLKLTREDVKVINELPLKVALGVRVKIARHREVEAREILNYLNNHIRYLENRDIFPSGY